MEAFLLGDCDEEIAIQIEDRLFADDGFYEQLQQVKMSLIARRAEGTLPESIALKFALQTSRSPLLTAAVEQARVHRADFLQERSHRQTGAFGNLRMFFQRLGNHSRILQFAAILTVAIALGVFFVEQRAMRTEGVGIVASKPHTAISKPALPSPKPASSLTVFLPANVLRSAGDVPNIQIKDQSQAIELQIEVHGPEHSHWSVLLLCSCAPPVRFDSLPQLAESSLSYIDLLLPPGELKPGVYRVQLSSEDQVKSPHGFHSSRVFRVLPFSSR